jgi:WD40 repeat protein
LWDVHSRLELAVLRGHEDYVNSVAFSPDGRRALSGEGVSTNKDKECTVRLWDIEAEREIAIMRGHKSAVLGVAFSPDGFRLVSVSDDQTMRVWDAQSKQELVVLRRDEWHFSSVAFSPNGRCVAIGLWDKTSGVLDATVRLWDIQSGKCLEILRGRGDVKAIAEGAAVLPCRAMVREGETVIEPATGGEPIAWLADALGPLSTHPEGSAWAGGVNSHLVLLQLEGPSPQ